MNGRAHEIAAHTLTKLVSARLEIAELKKESNELQTEDLVLRIEHAQQVASSSLPSLAHILQIAELYSVIDHIRSNADEYEEQVRDKRLVNTPTLIAYIISISTTLTLRLF